MSKTKNDKDAKKPAANEAKPVDGGWRETVESVAMAVILALLFRGFVAEAFVIPTGSMAPTLQGRHKDVKCPKCGTWYQVSGSSEQNEDRLSGYHVASTTCPICRYSHLLNPLAHPNEGSFSGDRIIVGKFCYDLAEPKRWDVIVFKFPGNAVQNYIKRLIGLPGERVRIAGGNIYTCGLNETNDALRIARKPPSKLSAMLQLVDDTDHIPKELIEVGWPNRWQVWPAAEKAAWQTNDGGHTFVCQGDRPEEAWLRYRHLIPSYFDWESIELNHQLPEGVGNRPGQLITDFYAYNTVRDVHSPDIAGWFPPLRSYWPPKNIPQHAGPGEPPFDAFLGQHWVDDIAVECLADIQGKQGELSLMLVRGGSKYFCRIDVASGKAVLSMTDSQGAAEPFVDADGNSAANPSAMTAVKGPGSYRLRLSNCDHELLLWVNGSVVKFDGPTTYHSDVKDDLPVPAFSADDPGDLAPAGIAARGTAVKLSSLRIYRDKYYIATDENHDSTDYDRPLDPRDTQRVFGNPDEWKNSGLFSADNRRHVEFPLQADQFLPMGDNSPQSSDARFWSPNNDGRFPTDHHYVERDLLIGKALLIYWPHTWNRPVPFTPNFSKMGPIR